MNREVRATLYAAFVHDEEEQRTVAQWLRRDFNIYATPEHLTWHDLSDLQDATMLYDLATLHYVLPRWLELLSTEDCPVHELNRDWLVWQLKAVSWLGWPPQQVEAVRCVFDEWRDEKFRAGGVEEFADFVRELEPDVARYLGSVASRASFGSGAVVVENVLVTPRRAPLVGHLAAG